MPLFLQFRGFDYVAYSSTDFESADSLPALKATGANSVGVNVEYGINALTSTIYSDAYRTENLTALGKTIAEAVSLGLSVMVKPLIDFVSQPVSGIYSLWEWRSYYNPTNPSAFFASYKSMIVAEAQVAQANGASLLSIGTEIDQLTGPQYLSYWTDIIAAVRTVYSGKLTYSADWQDEISPWQGISGLAAGTGDLATQVSFWSQLDYVGIDQYAALSDVANPTLADLVAGWTQVPTDPDTKAVTGNQSLISYYESLAAKIGKPLIFTEIGYESANDAAKYPYGSSTNVDDPALQARLYQALFDAWNLSGNNALAGVYFWRWDPNAANVGPGHGPQFSPQGLPAQDVVKAIWLDKVPPTATYLYGSETGPADFSVPRSLTLTLTTSEVVYVGATPQLALSNGLTAAYVSGSGTKTLVFSASMTSAPASATVTGLTGGTITDAAANAFDISGATISAYGVTISDTAANVAANIASLQSVVANVVSITLTDGSSQTLNLTQAQAVSNASVLALVSGPYGLHVTGVSGQSYMAYTNYYDAAKHLVLTIDFNPDGSVTETAFAGNQTLVGTAFGDTLICGAGNLTLDGGSNVDTAVVAGLRAAYTVTQTSTGKFTVTGLSGTDSLTNIEYLKFDDQTMRLLPGSGINIDWAADPSTTMAELRDFDGNNLGATASWKLIGTADVNGDGTAEHILVNRQNGRWAEVATEADGKTYMSNFSWAGDTRIVGIYIDPLVTAGEVLAGSDTDSQRRFQNDLNIENIHGVLGQNDYNHDGLQEIYFSLTDGTAYLHAYMHADGNIQYANYQNESQVKDYLISNGFSSSTWAGWFPAAQSPLAAIAGG